MKIDNESMMGKGYELMYDNILYNKLTNEIETVSLIDNVDRVKMNSRSEFVFLSNLHPIPLSEYWLKKLGFKKIKGALSGLIGYKIGGMIVWVSEKECFINDYINVKYIHQLQNLYLIRKGERLSVNSSVIEELNELNKNKL